MAVVFTANAWLSNGVAANRISFSQSKQDSFVVELLHKEGGVFIDVGASDGISNSNSYLLEAYHGWRGVCAEPGARQRLLTWLRPRCINIMAPISSREHVVGFHKSARTSEHGGIAETSGHLRRKTVDAREGSDIVNVRTATLNATLTAWRDRLWPGMQPQVVDYLSLDTEGHEYEALRGFPFERARLRVVTVERSEATPKVDRHLHNAGMKRVGRIGADDVWVTLREPLLVHHAKNMLATEPSTRRAGHRHANATMQAPRKHMRWREPVGLYTWLEGAAKEALPFLKSWR